MEPVLKFRVWDSLLKQWRNSPQLVLRPDGKVTDGSISIEEPVQFFIDLKDKNGKEIYEGDLVKFGYTENHDFFGRVAWFEDRAAFGIVSENAFETMEDLLDCMHLLEVIGNIYELPCKPDHNGECLLCDECVGGCPFLTLGE